MEKINKVISINLKQFRKERNLSLEKLSQLTGVSRAMLNQIEKGISNPTISTLWKISNGLHIPLSTLLKADESEIECIRKDDIVPIVSEDEKVYIYPMFNANTLSNRMDILNMTLLPQSSYTSSDQDIDSEEYIVVNSGNLKVDIEKQIHDLYTNDALRFSGKYQHIYINDTDETVQATVIINYNS